MIPADPLRGGPVGASSASGLSDDYSPGPSGSLRKKYKKFKDNEDEQVVLDAKHFAFYRGSPVIKVPGSSSFSLGVIFMGNDGDAKLLRHEYGHTIQLDELGLVTYLTRVVVPSVIFYVGSEVGLYPWENYYSYPWEYQADIYGGATHTYQPWADEMLKTYWRQ